MSFNRVARSVAKWFGAGIGVCTASYGAYVGATWLSYGKTRKVSGVKADPLLDVFMPDYEVVERRRVRVAAPAEITLAAASEMNLESCVIVRGIFRSREWIMRSKPDATIRPRGLVAQVKAMGWGILAELPGREIVIGAVTKPWEANPVFRALPPDEFEAFHEPGYVKIVWSLRADAVSARESVFRTETRARATDPEARKKFRRYWSFLSPGIIGIRVATLPIVKTKAERRYREIAA